MIDFHTHLDLYPDAISVARETSIRNKFTLAVTTSPRAWVATSRVLGSLPGIRVALGMHPEIVEGKASERDLLIDSVKDASFIGETGLDGTNRHRDSFKLQKAIFEDLLAACAAHGGRIISIHSRGAATAVLDLLAKYPDAGTPVLHWFSGTRSELIRAVKLGCWFSFGPAGVASKSGRELLGAIPLDKLLPESDGPFGQTDGKPLMPWEAVLIVPEVCRVQGVTEDFVENQLEQNLSEILRLNGVLQV